MTIAGQDNEGAVGASSPCSATSSSASSGNTNLMRSRSTVSLKHVSPDFTNQEDKMNTLTQMFWITISLMESDFEYEFLLAVKLLDKVIVALYDE